MKKLHRHFEVQIFGTDIDEEAIEIARAGVYTPNQLQNVSAERLKKYFSKEGKSYKINKEIRKLVIFAVQNITKDPPFTKLDLLSCRNLLIYFSTELQKKILPMFHYSLNNGGLLFLGSAENTGGFSELFKVLNKKWRLYQCKKEGATTLLEPHKKFHFESKTYPLPKIQQPFKDTIIPTLLEKILLESYAPICIVIDELDNIIYIHGKTAMYLEQTSGVPNLNILQMIRSDLKSKISAALQYLSKYKKQVTYSKIEIKDLYHNKYRYINLKIRRFRELPDHSNWKLIIIEEMVESPIPTHLNSKNANKKLVQKIRALEQELKEAQENLQILSEELQTTNEEYKSSNEELQSTNEELQSTNEELETSKEELQSLNEELTTVNIELESRIEDLYTTYDDLQNLLYSTEIAVLFLDNNFCIKRFTPKTSELYNLIKTDIGRPISDIVTKLKYTTLIDDCKEVITTLNAKTLHVQDQNNFWYKLRIMPYRTLSNMIDGAVVTFLLVEIDDKKENIKNI